jgi:hypothetical protein
VGVVERYHLENVRQGRPGLLGMVREVSEVAAVPQLPCGRARALDVEALPAHEVPVIHDVVLD